jgi:hypothetical protein
MVLAPPQVNTNGHNVWVPGYWRSPAERDHPPQKDDLLSLLREGQDYFRAFHAQCKLEEDYYLGRRSIPVPDGIEATWPATGHSIINVATDHVDVNNISIDVPSSPRSRARAERIKKFYQGVWLSIKQPVLRTAVRQSFLYGTSFIKTMFEADKWPEAPLLEEYADNEADYKAALEHFMDLRCITWPINVEVINPQRLIWDDSRAGMKWVMEFSQKNAREVKQRYPEWAGRTDSSGMTRWAEYWDEEWCVYLADDEIVWGPYKHGYGFRNYTQILPVHSYSFSDGAPQQRYVGILNPAHDLLDEEARLIAQIGAIVRTTAWRTLDFSGPPGLAQKAAEEYELFGGKNIIPPGVSVNLSPMGQVPPDLGDQLARVQNYIEQTTFPNVIRGVRPRGVSAGFPMSILAGMGRLVFQGVADGLRHAVEEVNSNFAKLVENKIKGRITVYARSDVQSFDQTIEPNDIRGMYENSCVVKAEAPEERERESLLAMRLHSVGILSLYEAMRRAGVTNPLEEQMQIRAEQLLKTPEYLSGQFELLREQLGLPGPLVQATGATGAPSGNIGSQNVGGAQLPRPGEANIQQARVASQAGQPSVFPQGLQGVDILGQILGGPTGGATNVPSGQRVGGG